MKKSHKWEDVPCLDIRCPYCGIWETHIGCISDKGDIVRCPHCDKLFELGQQK